MKKLLSIVLILIMAMLLVNMNNNTIGAVENSEYSFNYDGSSWSFPAGPPTSYEKDSELKFTSASGKGYVVDPYGEKHTIVQSGDAFYYTVLAAGATVSKTTTTTTDDTLVITDKVPTYTLTGSDQQEKVWTEENTKDEYNAGDKILIKNNHQSNDCSVSKNGIPYITLHKGESIAITFESDAALPEGVNKSVITDVVGPSITFFDKAYDKTLYFGQDKHSKWGLYKKNNDGVLSIEYVDSKDVNTWSASSNTLTLGSGFTYKSTGDYGICFTTDATLVITDFASIEMNNETTNITPAAIYSGNNNLTIKSTDDSAAMLALYVGKENNTSLEKGIVCNNLTVEDPVTTRQDGEQGTALWINGYSASTLIDAANIKIDNKSILQIFNNNIGGAINCTGTLELDNASLLEASRVSDGSITNEAPSLIKTKKLTLNNTSLLSALDYRDDEASTLEFELLNTTDVDNLLKNNSSIKLIDCHNYSAIKITPPSDEATAQAITNKLNEIFFAGVLPDSYDYTETYHDAGFEYHGDSQNDAYISLKESGSSNYSMDLHKVDDYAGIVELFYDTNQSKWRLAYSSDGSTYTDIPDNGTWKISDLSTPTNPVLTLNDGFTILSKNPIGLLIKPSAANTNLVINVEGDIKILSKYDATGGDKATYGIKVEDPNNYLKSIKFTSENGGGLILLTGSTDYVNVNKPTVCGMDAANADVIFEDVDLSIQSKDHKGTGISTAFLSNGSTKLTFNNSQVQFIGGELTSNAGGTGIAIMGVNNFENINDGQALLLANDAVLKLDNNSLTYKGGTFLTGDGNIIIVPKFGPYTDGEGNTFYTLLVDSIPCRFVAFGDIQKPTPTPSPSKKDESCEKVIGPTWHWNNDKGICEDIGVVGTSTR